MGIIIYGYNEHLGKSFETDDFCCPYCDHYNSTELFVSSNYFHVFFIPYIPTDKSGSTLCSHCKKVVQQVNFSPKMVKLFREKKNNTATRLKCTRDS